MSIFSATSMEVAHLTWSLIEAGEILLVFELLVGAILEKYR